jgi:transposase
VFVGVGGGGWCGVGAGSRWFRLAFIALRSSGFDADFVSVVYGKRKVVVMLTLGFSRRIFLRRGATDMRKSFDSLAGLVRSEFAADPLSGDAFVFVGKAVNRVKILVFDRSGFWVLSKRLSSGHFGVAGRWQAGGDANSVRVELSSAELQLLLEGIEIREARYRPQYRHPSGGISPA